VAGIGRRGNGRRLITLALVVIVPVMPAPSRDTGLFADSEAKDEHGHDGHSPLHAFEHDTKTFVDFGLFFFAFANAGMAFGAINTVTWIVLCSRVIGKTVGIFVFSAMATTLGSPLPDGMGNRHLIVAGLIASLGLTVTLFVSGEAFPGDSAWQGPAKMGAVLSAIVAFAAMGLGRYWKVSEGAEEEPATWSQLPGAGSATARPRVPRPRWCCLCRHARWCA
jgi:NhaA family Na+:H+ antiporter